MPSFVPLRPSGCISPQLTCFLPAQYEAAHLTLIDGLGTLPQVSSLSAAALRDLKAACVAKLLDLLGGVRSAAPTPAIDDSAERFAIGTFGLAKGPLTTASSNFSLRAPTTLDNAMRVLRGCQLTKPILLEGSPGVGKTSLITALAVATRNHLCRINLSDQTDLADLFGSDLPVENGRPGEFAWKDAAFLTALQSGQWVLLDEMNLASQAVLEGLNAVLDHRGTVYIPELGRSFTRHPDFRIFAAQNPVGQGGGRKGLPKSFLNRFTRVHVQELTPEDLRLICGQLYPVFPADRLERMIAFNSRLHQATMVERTIGRAGSPWEFNLRDVLRWLDLLHTRSGLEEQAGHPVEHLRTIYLQRFRTTEDRAAVLRLFAEHFDDALDLDCKPWLSASPQTAQVGHALIGRLPTVAVPADNLALLQAHLSPMEALARCVDSGWLVIVSGSPASGKSSLIQSFAQLAGRRLRSFAMNSGVDTMELLGSFEQADPSRRAQRIVERLLPLARQAASRVVTAEIEWLALSAELEAVEALSFDSPTDFHARVTAILDGLLPYLDEAEQLEYRWLVNALGQLSASGDTTGRFEWVDGELVQALTAGDWLVIDNANLCSASVLDRINSLCETQGTLVLSERGSVDGVAQVLTPHPHFRLFMTLDPRHGELSRAMRNRGVEIALDDLSAPADCQRISPIARRRVAGAKASTIDTAARSTDAWTTLVVSDSLLACSIPHDAAGALPTTPTTPTSGALLHSIAASSKASRAIVQQLLSAGDASSAALSSILLADLRASTTILAMTAHLESAAEAATGLPAAFLQCQVRPAHPTSLELALAPSLPLAWCTLKRRLVFFPSLLPPRQAGEPRLNPLCYSMSLRLCILLHLSTLVTVSRWTQCSTRTSSPRVTPLRPPPVRLSSSLSGHGSARSNSVQPSSRRALSTLTTCQRSSGHMSLPPVGLFRRRSTASRLASTQFSKPFTTTSPCSCNPRSFWTGPLSCRYV